MFSASLIVILLHGSFDFSYSLNYLSQFVQLSILVVVSGLIFRILLIQPRIKGSRQLNTLKN